MKHRVAVERMAYSSDSVGHLPNGKTVFVEGGAPQDIVEVELIEDRKSFARATITNILEPSPLRVKPLSPIDQLCGTAPWQHIAYASQLEAKRDNIVSALVRTARFDEQRAQETVSPCRASKREWNYRNKLELACGADPAGRFILGFHRERSDEVIPADSSRLAHKKIEKAPKALRGAIRYAQGSQDLGIFRIGVRHSFATGEVEVAIWTRPDSFPRTVFAKTISNALDTTSIVRVLADPGKARKVKGVEVLDGRGYWRERMGDIEFSTQAPSFFQVNTNQARKLVEIALEGLGDIEGAYIADLYAGGGTFSIPLALAGADVVAVESAKSSVRDLRHNADSNGVDIDIVGGDAAHELSELGALDALIVDPPRAGLEEKVVDDITEASPGRIAYISCDPATWARDIARFDTKGYRLVEATPVDLFPQTYHVEIASILSRR